MFSLFLLDSYSSSKTPTSKHVRSNLPLLRLECPQETSKGSTERVRLVKKCSTPRKTTGWFSSCLFMLPLRTLSSSCLSPFFIAQNRRVFRPPSLFAHFLGTQAMPPQRMPGLQLIELRCSGLPQSFEKFSVCSFFEKSSVHIPTRIARI